MSPDARAAMSTLIQESKELLAQMELALLEMERKGVDDESIGAVFRAAHTIKGSAGLFGLEHIVRFTHTMESVLDEIRGHRLSMDADRLSLFLACGDHLQLLVDGLEVDAPPDQLAPEKRDELLARLNADLAPHKAVAELPPLQPHVEVLDDSREGIDAWHISFRPDPELLKCGLDPVSVIRYLGTLGTVVHLEVLDDRLPRAADADPLVLYLGFEIQLDSAVSRERILEAFDFVSEGSTIRIVPPHGRVEEYLSILAGFPEPSARLGEMLVACGALTKAEVEQALARQDARTGKGLEDPARPPIGGVLTAEGVVPPVVVEAALRKQATLREHGGAENRVVKVEASKLDSLIDLVGELVISSAGARLSTLREGAKESEAAVANLAQLVERIRDSALGLRMVPVGEVFQRFPRMVRDLSKELGKRIDLSICGAETELDKSMVDRIVDPLTHIVRNALDHGIEPESVRVAAGKPPTGSLRFNAFAESGTIVVEVSDDGAGIGRNKVLAKAIRSGLVQEGQALSDREILDLVFQPGFSTAESVSDLSGRGVGMDVVRRNVAALRGEIELESEEGRGTTVRMRLPLTLAIIDGFLMQVGTRSFVVPLDAVVECADLSASEIHGGIFRLRGESLPLVRLREVFAIPDPPPLKESLVVAQQGSHRMGLVVDHLAGEHQAVIKPLGSLFREVRAVGGTTILGDGSVALILDLPHLDHAAARQASSSNPSFHPVPGEFPCNGSTN